MYAYITLKFELWPEEIEESISAQKAAEKLTNVVYDQTQPHTIVSIEVKDD